jgi:hypothetical protein
MGVAVQLLFEDGGRPIPRWRKTCAKSYVGELKVQSTYLNEFKRQSIVANLTDGMQLVVPVLIDATILNLLEGSMLLKGMNRDSLTNKITAQSWYVTLTMGN